jgi:hypothetical protein
VSAQTQYRDGTFPNKISRILLLALRDVIGENAMDTVLTTAHLPDWIGVDPPADFSAGLTFVELGRIFEALEGIYGVHGGRQVARQAGRKSFKYWVEGLKGVMGFVDVAFRLLPLSIRARIGMEVLSEIFNRYAGQRVTLGEADDGYFFLLDRSGFCQGRRTDAPACAFPAGVLEETLFWVSLGHRFMVEETTCVACGDPVCTFYVGQTPFNSSE